MAYHAGYGIHSVDFSQFMESIKALPGNGIISGMTHSVTGTNLIVTIASGSCRTNGTTHTFATSTDINFAGDPDTSNPKKALIVVDSSGAVTKRVGIAGVPYPLGQTGRYTYDPDPPEITSGDIVLCEVWLETNATAIHTDDVTDRKITVAGS